MEAKTIKFIPAALLTAVGFMAISAIACHVTGICDLYRSTRFVVLPAFMITILYGLSNREVGRIILRGWLFGVIAVTVYDMSRVPFMMAGWSDFIPTIGDWLMGEDGVHAVFGYAWRYIGNGGGLGIVFSIILAFVRPGINSVLLGTLFGLFVWLCLDVVLIVAPHATEMMFETTPLNVTGSFVGHVVFGLVLGCLNFYGINSPSDTPSVSE